MELEIQKHLTKTTFLLLESAFLSCCRSRSTSHIEGPSKVLAACGLSYAVLS